MMVGLPADAELVPDVSQAVVHQVADEVVRRPVEGEASLVARSHELHASQQRELVARPREREAHRPGQVADAHLVVGEGMHDPEPHRAREQTEHLHGVAHDLVGGQGLARGRDGPGVDDLRQGVPWPGWHLG